jgi:hypothetical protein
MCTEFKKAKIIHISRTQNQKADVVFKLAAGKDRSMVVLELLRPSIDVDCMEQYQIVNEDE